MRQKKHLHFLCLIGLSLASCTRESCQTPPSEPIAVKNAPSTATPNGQNEKPATDQVNQAHPNKSENETTKNEKSKQTDDNSSKESDKTTDSSKNTSTKKPSKESTASVKDKQEEKKASSSEKKKPSNSKADIPTSSDVKK